VANTSLFQGVTFVRDQYYQPKKNPTLANTIFYLRCSHRTQGCRGRGRIVNKRLSVDKEPHTCLTDDPNDRLVVMEVRRAMTEMKLRARDTSDDPKVRKSY
jgi:hypothetical protein